MSAARAWGVTRAEIGAAYPCDALADPPAQGIWRGVDVAAPAEVVFRWLCQLKVAPYSYDWIDNLGRRSPRRLTPGAERLERGQRVMTIFDLAGFREGEHLTMVIRPGARRVFGPLAISYVVRPAGPGACRLVVKQAGTCATRGARLRFALLAWGDLVMMRRQLLNLAALAEGSSGRGRR